jgi:glycopeptide antibiotics resistance protein
MMKFLFLLVCILIAYGSLYPFDFRAIPPGEWVAFLGSWNQLIHRGDVLANVVLFLPFGYLGALLFGRKAWLLWSAVLLGGGLQVAQLYLPSRDANLLDVIWNLLGTLVGAGIGQVFRFQMGRWGVGIARQSFIWLLMGAWLAYRLMPFVPGLDWQQIKHSLKPLLLQPSLSWSGVFHDTVAWMVFACLWQATYEDRHRLRNLSILVMSVLALEVIVVNNTLSASNVLGAAMGLVVWLLWLQHWRNRVPFLALVLTLMIVVNGLAPFELRAMPAAFHWLPFHGFLGGSMLVNVAALFEKIFFFGALLWLLRQKGGSLRFATLFVLCVVSLTELGQVYVIDHTPEITDVLLVLILVLVQRVLGVVRHPLPGTTAISR